MNETDEGILQKIESHPIFIEWLQQHEMWLMERILRYAKDHGYTKYTSTLLEPWRISIEGLTDSLRLLMLDHPEPPALHPDESYNDDPASAFGLLEAQRHRSRGVNFAMFISLFKYYRQSYHDLIEEHKERFVHPEFYYEYVKVFFDRVEIAYSIEWHGRSSEDQIHELSQQNRFMTNEKNLYLTVFDSFSSGAILLDTFGVIINYNQNASEVLFGNKQHGGRYYYNEHKTAPTPEWISDAIGDLGDNDSHRFYFEQIREKKRFIYDVFIRPMDDISGKFSGFILILSDVSELKSSQERFELAIGATKDGLWDWNLIDNTLYFSPQWKEMLGYSDDELKNELDTWEKLVHPDDITMAEKAIETSLKDPSVKYEIVYRLRHKKGHYLWNLDRGDVLYDSNGTPVRMIGFHTDVSEQISMSEKIHDTQELMIAQSRHAAMGEMIGMIAHQWRQPLSIISMVVNNMIMDIELEEINAQSCRSSSDDILVQINYLSKTIDDFRDFFRPDKQKEKIDIAKVIGEAQSMMGASFENHQITITVVNESVQNVETFSRELLQVFINILKNAKEVLLSNEIKDPTIEIRLDDEADAVVTRICDNGGGIHEEIIPLIFDPYFSTKDEKTGTGLGLFMSKTIIEKHLKGTISVENSSKGACFTIRLPKQIV